MVDCFCVFRWIEKNEWYTGVLKILNFSYIQLIEFFEFLLFYCVKMVKEKEIFVYICTKFGHRHFHDSPIVHTNFHFSVFLAWKSPILINDCVGYERERWIFNNFIDVGFLFIWQWQWFLWIMSWFFLLRES